MLNNFAVALTEKKFMLHWDSAASWKLGLDDTNTKPRHFHRRDGLFPPVANCSLHLLEQLQVHISIPGWPT